MHLLGTYFSFFSSLETRYRSLAQPWPISEWELTSIYTEADIVKGAVSRYLIRTSVGLKRLQNQ